MAISIVTVLDTFLTWMNKTNQTITSINGLSDGTGTTQIANNSITGRLFNLVSDTPNILIANGSPQSSNTINIQIGTLATRANDVSVSNIASAYVVNTAHLLAVTAYRQANTNSDNQNTAIATAYAQANTAYNQGNNAYGASNTVLTTAQAAYARGNTSTQLAFLNLVANGNTITASSNTDNVYINGANGYISLTANVTTKTVSMNLAASGVTAGTYGNTSSIPAITVDSLGRVTAASNNSITTRFVGELIPYGGNSAPALTVFAYGQNLSRTTYAALFAVFGTLHGTGDGSTTFGVPDLRGRTIVGKDNMGGSAANRVTSSGQDAIDGTTLGTAGGAQDNTLDATRQASQSFSGTTGNDSPDHTHGVPTNSSGTGPGTVAYSNYPVNNGSGYNTTGASARHQHSFSGSTTNGGGAHKNMQPSIILNYLIFAGA